MMELLILGFALVLVSKTAGSPTGRDGCCLEKTVGGVTFTFLEKGDTGAYSCLSDCVYVKKGEMGPKFCFAIGEQEVQCEDSQPPVDPTDMKGSYMSYHDEKICGERLKSFLSAGPNETLTIRCCNGTNISTCVGHGCLKECGGNITCMIPVSDKKNTEDCTEDTTAFVLMNERSCKMLVLVEPDPFCPVCYRDSRCTCCKFPAYTSKNTRPNDTLSCKKDCRCNGICDWLNQRGISVVYLSWCKGCPKANCSRFETPDLVTSPTPTAIDSSPSPTPTAIDSSPSPTPTAIDSSPSPTPTAIDSSPSPTPTAIDSSPSPTPTAIDSSHSPPNCTKVHGEDCSLCEMEDYADACVQECRCNCVCMYITGCTGSNAPLTSIKGFSGMFQEQWIDCWLDYSYCCDCPNNSSVYSIPCGSICDDGNTFGMPPIQPGNPPVPTKFIQSTVLNCTGS